MGWNDRLPDCDQALPSEEDREAYFAWQEYHHYLASLEDALGPSEPPPAGPSSQTIDPAQLGDLAKDIFAPSRNLSHSKEHVHGREQGQIQNPDRVQEG